MPSCLPKLTSFLYRFFKDFYFKHQPPESQESSPRCSENTIYQKIAFHNVHRFLHDFAANLLPFSFPKSLQNQSWRGLGPSGRRLRASRTRLGTSWGQLSGPSGGAGHLEPVLRGAEAFLELHKMRPEPPEPPLSRPGSANAPAPGSDLYVYIYIYTNICIYIYIYIY